jgi:hypothetical protein
VPDRTLITNLQSENASIRLQLAQCTKAKEQSEQIAQNNLEQCLRERQQTEQLAQFYRQKLTETRAFVEGTLANLSASAPK